MQFLYTNSLQNYRSKNALRLDSNAIGAFALLGISTQPSMLIFWGVFLTLTVLILTTTLFVLKAYVAGFYVPTMRHLRLHIHQGNTDTTCLFQVYYVYFINILLLSNRSSTNKCIDVSIKLQSRNVWNLYLKACTWDWCFTYAAAGPIIHSCI